MSINTQYVLAPSLQEYFVDKVTGLPLAKCLVYFFQDINRTTPKAVYEISGSPPNYSFIQLPNPITLSSVGTIQDNNGNDVLPYYFPYDSAGNVDLYYIVVTDQFGSVQFTREAFPSNLANSAPVTSNSSTNLIPNGQFLLHNNIIAPPKINPALSTFNYGIYTTNVNDVAPGGWTYEVSNTTIATDTITFNRFTSYVPNPSASPRYAFNISRTVASADQICDLRIKFNDVNKFASTTQTFTLLFTAQSNNGSSLPNVNIDLIKYYGSGGTPATTTDNPFGGPITITTSETQFAISNVFGINNGALLGLNDDDFIQLAIRFPASSNQLFNIQITDVMLVIGTVIAGAIQFPPTTNGEFVLEALSNLAPTTNSVSSAYYAEDGSNLYLPMIMTLEGFTYDYSAIGSVYASYNNTPIGNSLACNGQQLNATTKSTLGIPYQRLQQFLLASSPSATIGVPLFGTGLNYVTAIISFSIATNYLYIANNGGGITNPVTDFNTGFTFTTITTGVAPVLPIYSYGIRPFFLNGAIICINVLPEGSIASATAGTSGFTVTQIRNSAAAYYYSFFVTPIAAAGLAGKYFTFSSLNSGGTPYYVWFTVNGAGADPAPGGTGIKVALNGSMNGADLANLLGIVLTGGNATSVIPLIGSSVVPGSYFTFSTNNVTSYYVWYNVSGVGNDPAPGGGSIGIEVQVLSTDTSAQVAAKTQLAINLQNYALPNLQGMFLRGVDPNQNWDISTLNGWGYAPGVDGLIAGTFSLDNLLYHNHTASSSGTTTVGRLQISTDGASSGTIGAGNGDLSKGLTDPQLASTAVTTTVGFTGQPENTPVNALVNWYIRY